MQERKYTRTDKDGNVWSKDWRGYGLNGGPVPMDISTTSSSTKGLNQWQQFAFIKVEQENYVRLFSAKCGFDIDNQDKTQRLMDTLDRIEINCDQTAIKYLTKIDFNGKLLFSDDELHTFLCYICKNDSWDHGAKLTGEQLFKFIPYGFNKDKLSSALQTITQIKQINNKLRQNLSDDFIAQEILLLLLED